MPKDMPAQVGDGLVNVISGVGTSADKNIANRYALDCLDQGQAEAMYRTSWLARKVVDLPPFDMTRAWRDWQAEDDQIELLEAEEKRLNLASKVRRALVLAALHGGGALILGGPKLGDPTLELAKNIPKGALEYVHVVSRYQLTMAGDIERDINSPWFGHPQRWVLSGTQQEMHPSRVIAFVGQPLPEGSLVGGLDAFWGDSLLSTLKGAITNADLVQSAIAALVNEAKVDTLKIPGLTDLLMTAEGEAQLMKRINVANLAKSLLNTRILDKDEDWETMQLTFSQLDSIARTFLQIAAGAADIPATRLLGTAPQGMNATGEGDHQNYDTMIASKQESDLRPPLERLDEVLIPSVLGSRPPELHWSFAPLRVETEGQKADVAKKKAETTQIYANSGLLPDTALAKSVQNQLVEDGVYPGLEEALADAEKAGEVPSILEEPEEPDPSALQAPANGNEPPERGAKQAAVDSLAGARATRMHGGMWDRAMDAMRRVLGDARPRSLYVSRQLLNAEEFLAWARGQGFKNTLAAGDLHVTVLYSREAVDWMKMGDNWSSDQNGNLTVPAGGARIVEGLGAEGAVVLLFSSTDLQWRHRNMVEAGASHDYEEYQPHVTITYEAGNIDLSKVEPFRGKLVFGPEVFEEIIGGGPAATRPF